VAINDTDAVRLHSWLDKNGRSAGGWVQGA
jgi:hypothetical protein